MDQGPLVREEIEAGENLAREFNQFAPLKAAFWLRAGEDDYRDLYLTSDKIDDTNFREAYGEVGRLMGELDSPYLGLFRVKVIRGDHPLAVAAADLNQRYSNRHGTRFGGTMFGGMYVEDVYLYPSPLPQCVS